MTDHVPAPVVDETGRQYSACCGHAPWWHHDTRGCGYFGHGEGACPCALLQHEALTAYVAAERERAVAEVVEPIRAVVDRWATGHLAVDPDDRVYTADVVKTLRAALPAQPADQAQEVDR